MDFNLNLPTRVFYGENCIDENSSVLKTLGSRCLIVTGKNGAKLSGALFDAVSALEKEDIQYKIFDKIGQNPLLSSCFEAGKAAYKFNADFIVGIGGGSALDAAKAAAVFAANAEIDKMDIYSSKIEKKGLPIVAIGTTSGTGSEIGRVAVLTIDETNKKKSISGDGLFPVFAFADWRYTKSMSNEISYSTALDALCHAMEGYYSPKCGMIADMFALKAVKMIVNSLKKIENENNIDDECRKSLFVASLCAGVTLAFCGTAFPHQLGYILTENYNVPHGFACAAFLPEFAQRANKFCFDKHQKMLNNAEITHDELVKLIEHFTILPKNIKMTEAQIDEYCSRWDIIPPHFKCSPGGYDKENTKNNLKRFSED